MPRRRPSNKSNSRSKPRSVDRKDSKIKRWDKPSDIELDEEDQFHASRDKILLSEEEDVDDADEDEVFALEGMSDEEDEEDEDGDQVASADDEHVEDEHVGKKSKKKSKSKKALSSSSDTGSEDETWGRSRSAYYSSNAAQIDSEDEEANELEEQEARRLQVKARDAIHEDDFGLGEGLEEEPTAEVEDLLEEPSHHVLKVTGDKNVVLRHLEKENPEALALARDWDDTARNLVGIQAKIAAISEKETDGVEIGLLHTYYQALLTYATTLAYYLHLRASEKYAARPLLLRKHPILNRLLTLKQSLVTLESLGVGSESQDEDDEDENEDDELGSDSTDLWNLILKQGIEADELAGLLSDAGENPAKASKKDKREAKPPKKKRKTSNDAKMEDLTFDLIEPEFEFSSSTSAKKHLVPVDANSTDAFGESTFLQHADAIDKQARKKTLRFHVSRIEGASARRQNARSNAVGGDDDLPYRERRKEKEHRMEKERKRKTGTLGLGGDDLDDLDPEIVDAARRSKKRQREADEDGDSDKTEAHGYYELIKRQASEKKTKKKADYEEARAAERSVFGEDDVSGPRSITRTIMKNKGLTPHRSKSVRNPRVKKRQKYEQAKKRVSSQRAVFKGGVGDVSKYTGEQSGISKVIKSVRLG